MTRLPIPPCQSLVETDSAEDEGPYPHQDDEDERQEECTVDWICENGEPGNNARDAEEDFHSPVCRITRGTEQGDDTAKRISMHQGK